MKPKEFFFPRACPAGVHAALLQAYRDGYESALAGRASVGERNVYLGQRVQDGYALPKTDRSWTCEVEAYEKVFTGMGSSQAEAAAAAHTTCAAHFRASYCQKTECKVSL